MNQNFTCYTQQPPPPQSLESIYQTTTIPFPRLCNDSLSTQHSPIHPMNQMQQIQQTQNSEDLFLIKKSTEMNYFDNSNYFSFLNEFNNFKEYNCSNDFNLFDLLDISNLKDQNESMKQTKEMNSKQWYKHLFEETSPVKLPQMKILTKEVNETFEKIKTMKTKKAKKTKKLKKAKETEVTNEINETNINSLPSPFDHKKQIDVSKQIKNSRRKNVQTKTTVIGNTQKENHSENATEILKKLNDSNQLPGITQMQEIDSFYTFQLPSLQLSQTDKQTQSDKKENEIDEEMIMEQMEFSNESDDDFPEVMKEEKDIIKSIQLQKRKELSQLMNEEDREKGRKGRGRRNATIEEDEKILQQLSKLENVSMGVKRKKGRKPRFSIPMREEADEKIKNKIKTINETLKRQRLRKNKEKSHRNEYGQEGFILSLFLQIGCTIQLQNSKSTSHSYRKMKILSIWYHQFELLNCKEILESVEEKLKKSDQLIKQRQLILLTDIITNNEMIEILEKSFGIDFDCVIRKRSKNDYMEHRKVIMNCWNKTYDRETLIEYGEKFYDNLKTHFHSYSLDHFSTDGLYDKRKFILKGNGGLNMKDKFILVGEDKFNDCDESIERIKNKLNNEECVKQFDKYDGNKKKEIKKENDDSIGEEIEYDTFLQINEEVEETHLNNCVDTMIEEDEELNEKKLFL